MALKQKNIPVILASGSPRRQEILSSLEIDYKIILPDVDEKAFDTEKMAPEEKVVFLSQKKAQAVAEASPDSIVIGSDTIVVFKNGTSGFEILEKPEDEDDTKRMLKLLSGTTHSVLSAITVCYQGKSLSDYFDTRVTFDALSDEQIDWYISTGEPKGKAGGYAIQGFGSLFVQGIEGCYFNVVGMSPYLLNQLVKQILV